MALLRNIARADGVAVLCSLHQVAFARAYADRIIGLSHGRVVLAAPADQFDETAYASLYGGVVPITEAIADAPGGANATSPAPRISASSRGRP